MSWIEESKFDRFNCYARCSMDIVEDLEVGGDQVALLCSCGVAANVDRKSIGRIRTWRARLM